MLALITAKLNSFMHPFPVLLKAFLITAHEITFCAWILHTYIEVYIFSAKIPTSVDYSENPDSNPVLKKQLSIDLFNLTV